MSSMTEIPKQPYCHGKRPAFEVVSEHDRRASPIGSHPDYQYRDARKAGAWRGRPWPLARQTAARPGSGRTTPLRAIVRSADRGRETVGREVGEGCQGGNWRVLVIRCPSWKFYPIFPTPCQGCPEGTGRRGLPPGGGRGCPRRRGPLLPHPRLQRDTKGVLFLSPSVRPFLPASRSRAALSPRPR